MYRIIRCKIMPTCTKACSVAHHRASARQRRICTSALSTPVLPQQPPSMSWTPVLSTTSACMHLTARANQLPASHVRTLLLLFVPCACTCTYRRYLHSPCSGIRWNSFLGTILVLRLRFALGSSVIRIIFLTHHFVHAQMGYEGE